MSNSQMSLAGPSRISQNAPPSPYTSYRSSLPFGRSEPGLSRKSRGDTSDAPPQSEDQPRSQTLTQPAIPFPVMAGVGYSPPSAGRITPKRTGSSDQLDSPPLSAAIRSSSRDSSRRRQSVDIPSQLGSVSQRRILDQPPSKLPQRPTISGSFGSMPASPTLQPRSSMPPPNPPNPVNPARQPIPSVLVPYLSSYLAPIRNDLDHLWNHKIMGIETVMLQFHRDMSLQIDEERNRTNFYKTASERYKSERDESRATVAQLQNRISTLESTVTQFQHRSSSEELQRLRAENLALKQQAELGGVEKQNEINYVFDRLKEDMSKQADMEARVLKEQIERQRSLREQSEVQLEAKTREIEILKAQISQPPSRESSVTASQSCSTSTLAASPNPESKSEPRISSPSRPFSPRVTLPPISTLATVHRLPTPPEAAAEHRPFARSLELAPLRNSNERSSNHEHRLSPDSNGKKRSRTVFEDSQSLSPDSEDSRAPKRAENEVSAPQAASRWRTALERAPASPANTTTTLGLSHIELLYDVSDPDKYICRACK
ncbi:hypothetical protein C8J56DRAFT_964789 [Mycena floridula]|nr:hypothetical protein C8J56DRAFT_964789 [Mycena floridula]